MALLDLLNPQFISDLFFWMEKLGAVITVWWLGGKFSHIFSNKLSKSKLLIIRIITGIIIYLSGIIIGAQYLNFLPSSMGDIGGALISFAVLYFATLLITIGIPTQIVSRDEFDLMSRKVKSLESLIRRVYDSLVEEKMMPKKVDLKEGEKIVSKYMQEERKYSEWEITHSEMQDENLAYYVQCKIRTYKLILDPFTGDVLQFKHAKNNVKNLGLSIMNYFYGHKLAITGLIIITLFIGLTATMQNEISSTRFNELINLTPPPSNSSPFDTLLGGFGFIPSNLSSLNDLPINLITG